MISPLWILNSSLVGILVTSFLTTSLLHISTPRVITIKSPVSGHDDELANGATRFKLSLEKIYQQDIFKTFSPKKQEAVKQVLVSPIPDFTPPVVTPPPAPPTYDFIAPLDLNIKGIIMSDDEERCVAMIEDDAKKEGMYYLGDKIKDAQIIKIAKNRVVFLRGANGQLETCFLKKEESLIEKDPKNRWKHVARMTEPNHYEVDPNNFKEEFDSLGHFLDQISVVGTVYQRGTPVGIKIGALDKGSIGEALGLQQGDVVTSVNKISTLKLEDRMAIFNVVTEAKLDDTITVNLSRAGVDQVMYYKLVVISKAKPSLFGQKDPAGSDKPDNALTRSPLQEREQAIREFKQKHQSPDQGEAIARIRQRLLDNLKNRANATRVR